MPRIATIELFKESMKFSAGHFTIFSATERENLHGHNFTVHVSLTGIVDENGLLFDYGTFKQKIIELCQGWNETFFLPGRSPHLRVDTSDSTEIRCHFNGEVMRFLPRDITVLPVRNVTLEELSELFGARLLADPLVSERADLIGMVVKCASGPGQWASWTWNPEETL